MMDGSRKIESPLAGASKTDASDLKFGDCIASSTSKSERGFVDMDSVAPAIETRETRAARSGIKPRSAAACEPRSGEPWENTNNVTPPPTGNASGLAREDVRRLAYARRLASRKLLIRWNGGDCKGFDPIRLPRCAKCGQPVESAIGIKSDGKRSKFTGAMMCGSIWSCPVCSRVIRSARSAEVETMVHRHVDRAVARARQNPNTPIERAVPESCGLMLFGTLTLRHSADMPLQMLLDAVMSGWRRMVNGSPWRRIVKRYGIVGYVRSIEITYGVNGWHPHVHFLMPLAHEMSKSNLRRLRKTLIVRWRKMVKRVAAEYGKYNVAPDNEHGIDLQLKRGIDEGKQAADYVTKWQKDKGNAELALEIAHGDNKGGRAAGSVNPFQLLDPGILGLEDWRREQLWREYYEATLRRRCITWSRGLRELYDVGEEVEDEAIANEEKPEELVEYVAPKGEYERLRKTDAGLLADILTAAEQGDWEFVDKHLHGVRLTIDQQDMLADGEAHLADFLPQRE